MTITTGRPGKDLTNTIRPGVLKREGHNPQQQKEEAMTTTTVSPRAATVTLGADPADRYRTATLFIGQWVTLVCGDFAVEGRLTSIEPPDPSGDTDDPVATISTGRARVTGPLLPGDILVP